jgi:hypothetical protein
MKGRLTTCPQSGKLLKSAGLTVNPSILNKFVQLKMQMLGIQWTAMQTPRQEEKGMNLSLLQRPKKIKKGTHAMYIYHPAVVTTSAVLEPGDVLKILDVFEGDTPSETTLKVIKAQDWEGHYWGRDMDTCRKDKQEKRGEAKQLCDCEKELSEMSDEFKAVVHYVLLSDVGK